jgi:hypothetical protein
LIDKVVRMMQNDDKRGGTGSKKAGLIGRGPGREWGVTQSLYIYNIVQVPVPIYKGTLKDIST